MNELKPCPFCGDKDVVVTKPAMWQGWCRNCTSIGAPRTTAEEAIEAWNRRAINSCKTCKYMTDNVKNVNYRNGYCSRWEAGNWYKISGDDYCSFWEGMDDGNSD